MKYLLFILIGSFIFISCKEEFYNVKIQSEYEKILIFELVDVGKEELENGESYVWEEVEGNKNYSLIVSEAITPDNVLAYVGFNLDKNKTFTITADGIWKR